MSFQTFKTFIHLRKTQMKIFSMKSERFLSPLTVYSTTTLIVKLIHMN